MDVQLLMLPIMTLLLGAFAFAVAWLWSLDFDRKWGRHDGPPKSGHNEP